jgi:hypothetical protein
MQIRPSDLEKKSLALEAPGQAPVGLNLVVPSRVRPNAPIQLRVAAIDADWFPSLEYADTIEIVLEGGGCVAEVEFGSGFPAVAVVDELRAPSDEGFYRFAATLGGRTFYSNPMRVVDRDLPKLYWGDPHVHTVLSLCHPEKCRSLNFCYTAARWLSGLDFVAATDHVSNGRCDVSKWKEQRLASELYNDEGAFVTLPAYEASFKGMAGGDNNVYMRRWPEHFVDDYEEGTVRTVVETLKAQLAEDDFFAVPHHTTRTGKHGEIPDDIYPGPALMPVMEIHSRWGTSEYRGNPEPLAKIHDGPSYAVDLLNRGLKLGFIAGTDTHSTIAAGYGPEDLNRRPGLTAVIADRLSRDSVFDAIRTRNCYAAKGERIYLDAELDASGGNRIIRGEAAGQSDVETVELVRNGITVDARNAESWHTAFEFSDNESLESIALDSAHMGRFVYYYIRVTCASGAQAWSSPWWISI